MTAIVIFIGIAIVSVYANVVLLILVNHHRNISEIHRKHLEWWKNHSNQNAEEAEKYFNMYLDTVREKLEP